MAATPTPSPLFQAFDPATGLPLVGGKVFTYDAGTSTPATTWADAAEGSANSNPVILDANGQAPIFIDGQYKFVVKDAADNLLFEIDDIIGGTNVFDRDASGVNFLPFDDITSTNVQAAIEELGGKRVKTSAVTAINRGGTGQITAAAAVDALDQTASADVASATTTDIGAAASQKVRITGSVTITGLGTVAAGTERWVTLAAAPLITHNATSLILPGAISIQGAAGDAFHATSLGSGNWRVDNYVFADGSVLGDQGISTVASATTCAIAAAGTYNNVSITGTTTITGFGTIKAGIRRKGVFTGSLTLTHDAASLILPGGKNITTAAGDTFDAVSLGSGNWRVLSYQRATSFGAWTTALKSVDENRAVNSTANDADLQFAMAANTTYRVRITVFYSQTNNNGRNFKFALSGPASPTLVRGWSKYVIPAATSEVVGNLTAYPSVTMTTGGASGDGWIRFELAVQNGANPGTFAFGWGISGTDDTATVRKGSSLEYTSI